MKYLIASSCIPLLLVLLLAVLQTSSAQVCQPLKSESLFYRTRKMEDLYVALDYELGRYMVVFGNDPHGANWVILDLNTKDLYASTTDGGCEYMAHQPDDQRLGYALFEQCLPDDAQLVRSGLVNFYYMERPSAGLAWLVGMKPVPGTEFYYTHFSRFFSKSIGGVADVNADDSFGIVYEYSVGIRDPTIFDKDFSRCVEGSADK